MLCGEGGLERYHATTGLLCPVTALLACFHRSGFLQWHTRVESQILKGLTAPKGGQVDHHGKRLVLIKRSQRRLCKPSDTASATDHPI